MRETYYKKSLSVSREALVKTNQLNNLLEPAAYPGHTGICSDSCTTPGNSYPMGDHGDDRHDQEYGSQRWNSEKGNPFAAIHSAHGSFQSFGNQVHARHNYSVIKKANAKPKMMVHDNGFQNITLITTKEYVRIQF